MKCIMMALLLLCAAIANAAVYEQENNQGGISYSDTPLIDSKPINPPETTNSIPVLQTEMNGDSRDNESLNQAYKTFVIISPKDQETTQGQSDIPVNIKLEPELRVGDKIQIMIDNKPFGKPSTDLTIYLNELSRGIHQLSAAIIDGNQHILQQTPPFTLNVHRTSSVLSPAFIKPPPPLPK